MGERIRDIYQESRVPFDALWKWASGEWLRWRALNKWSRKHMVKARKDRAQRERELERQREQHKHLRKLADGIHRQLDRVREAIESQEQLPEPDYDRLAELEAKRDKLLRQLVRLRERMDDNLVDIERGKKRRDDAKEAAKFWLRKHTVYRRKWKAARKRHRQRQEPRFETWMLNGHPGNVDANVKKLIAYAVVALHQAVTSTTDFTHAVSSFHYPRNAPNSDNEGHAFDFAGPAMADAALKLRNKFGTGFFMELFSPAGWYIKYRQVIAGYFPGHGDHGHAAPYPA